LTEDPYLPPLTSATDQTGPPIIVADDPLATVVLGAGKLLNDPDLLMKVSVN